jgi:hypothetical protein
MSENENIIFPEGLEITSKNYMKFTEPFLIEIKVRILNYLMKKLYLTSNKLK